MVLERCIQPGFVTDRTHRYTTFSQQPMCGILHIMMLFNCICFQEMTIPGNALPKFFSVPWDKAPPPATPTTPSVLDCPCEHAQHILLNLDKVANMHLSPFSGYMLS